MAQFSLHPTLDRGLPAGTAGFAGGRLTCRCRSDRVVVEVTGNVEHNHACGCSKCWKPAGALFSVVGVVPADRLRIVAHEEKLHVVDPAATIERHACHVCGTHMVGRITRDHAFKGYDFVHVELSEEEGWQPPQFAGFVSSVIEQGFRPEGMEAVRGRFHELGLETYDCLSPPLMDAIAAYAAKQAPKPPSPPAGAAAGRRPGVAGLLGRLLGR